MILIETNNTGHRLYYVDYIHKEISKLGYSSKVSTKLFTVDNLTAKKVILFSFDETKIVSFLFVLFRSMLLNNTYGLTVHIDSFIEKKIWYYYYLTMKIIGLKICSIVPGNIQTLLKNIVEYEFIDFQFCDIINNDSNYKTFSAKSNADGVITLIGNQQDYKGFSILTNAIEKGFIDIENVFIHGSCKKLSNKYYEYFKNSGRVVNDSYLSDEELIKLYQESKIIWACYDKEYNQSSGIAGRAFQFNKTVIVRRNSNLHLLLMYLNYSSVIAIDSNDFDELRNINKLSTINNIKHVKDVYEKNQSVLVQLLQ